MEHYSKDFGKKERVLNYACQTYQLSRPNNVGAVMHLSVSANLLHSKNGKLGFSKMLILIVRHL